MKIFLMAIFLFVSISISAQNKTDLLNKVSTHISDGIKKNYHPNKDSINTFCRIGCVFTKFEVNANGKIINLSFSDRSPVFIKTALSEVVNSFQSDAELIKLLRRTKTSVFIPLLYYYQKGCHLPNEDMTLKKDNGKVFWENYVKATLDMDHTAETVAEMLNFDKMQLRALDCILISPYVVGETGNGF